MPTHPPVWKYDWIPTPLGPTTVYLRSVVNRGTNQNGHKKEKTTAENAARNGIIVVLLHILSFGR